MNLKFDGRPFTADPMMLAMNHLKYDAMAVGNHEFNYGLEEPEQGSIGRAISMAFRQHENGSEERPETLRVLYRERPSMA